MRAGLRLRGLPALCALLAAASCGGGADSAPSPRVFAAASLTEAFEALADAHAAAGGRRPELHFAGTPRLVLQLSEGAPGEVFASADAAQMERLRAAGRVSGEIHDFAVNRLALIVPPGNPGEIDGLADLARAELKVALCGPEVPAGRYARRALAAAGVEVRSVSDEPSVKALVSKVALGELDAAIVYATDARAAHDRVDPVAVPEPMDVAVHYPIAVLADARNPESARAFVDFVLSGDGQAILQSFGFERP